MRRAVSLTKSDEIPFISFWDMTFIRSSVGRTDTHDGHTPITQCILHPTNGGGGIEHILSELQQL